LGINKVFFKSTPKNNLTKIYFSPRSSGDQVDLKKITDICLNDCPELPSKISINYRKEQEFALVSKYLNSLTYQDLECLIVVDKHDNLMLTIAKEFGSSEEDAPIFECAIVNQNDKLFSKELKIFDAFAAAFAVHYGYARTLKKSYSLTSETKIKRSLFGSLSATVQKKDDIWLMNHKEISIGAIKGVYPVNFWSSKSLKRLNNLEMKLLSSSNISECIYAFDEQQQLDIIAKNPKFKKFLHFSDV
jgi:hypothetical protein